MEGFAGSPDQDLARPLVAASRTPAWRTYLERILLLLGFNFLLSLLVGWAITVLALPGESPALAVQAALGSLPALLVFVFLALLIAGQVQSGPGGAATSAALWLFFLLNRGLAHRLPWVYFYPSYTYFQGTSDLVMEPP